VCLFSCSFVSVTETDLDYSIVCDEDCLPRKYINIILYYIYYIILYILYFIYYIICIIGYYIILTSVLYNV